MQPQKKVRQFPNDFLEDLPEELRKKVKLLRAVSQVQKEIPNLPMGGLRTSISDELNCLLDGKESLDPITPVNIGARDIVPTHILRKDKEVSSDLGTSIRSIPEPRDSMVLKQNLFWVIFVAFVVIGLVFNLLIS